MSNDATRAEAIEKPLDCTTAAALSESVPFVESPSLGFVVDVAWLELKMLADALAGTPVAVPVAVAVSLPLQKTSSQAAPASYRQSERLWTS